jgi:hypothetical protein
MENSPQKKESIKMYQFLRLKYSIFYIYIEEDSHDQNCFAHFLERFTR